MIINTSFVALLCTTTLTPLPLVLLLLLHADVPKSGMFRRPHSPPFTASPPPPPSTTRPEGFASVSASVQGRQIDGGSQQLCQSCGVETGQGQEGADFEGVPVRGVGGGGGGGSNRNQSPLSPRSDAAVINGGTNVGVKVQQHPQQQEQQQPGAVDSSREVGNSNGVTVQATLPDCPGSGSLVPAAPPSELKYGDRLRLWTRYVAAAGAAVA